MKIEVKIKWTPAACLLAVTALAMNGCARPDATVAAAPVRPAPAVQAAAPAAAGVLPPPGAAPTPPRPLPVYVNVVLPPDELDGVTISHRSLLDGPGGAEVAVVTVDNHTRYDLGALTLTLTLDAEDAQGRALPTMTLPCAVALPPQVPGQTGPLKCAATRRVRCRPVLPVLPPGARLTGYFMTVAHAEGFPQTIDQSQPLSEQMLQAAEVGDMDAATELLAAHPSLRDVRDPRDGATPLHDAAMFNHLALARYLLSRGAAVNSRDRWGNTALYYAIYDINPRLVRLLLAHGANALLRGRIKYTPLSLAQLRAAEEGGGAAGADEILRMVEARAGGRRR